jgi:hypothetical protein
VVARRPEHDPAVMLRSYAKVLPSDDKRVREAFSAARSPVNGTKLGPGATLFTGRSAKTLEKLAGVEGLRKASILISLDCRRCLSAPIVSKGNSEICRIRLGRLSFLKDNHPTGPTGKNQK